MSRIKFIIYYYLSLAILLMSCTQNNKNQLYKNGFSKTNVSSFSYVGLVERSIKLKFIFSKNESSTLIAQIETDYDYPYPLHYKWSIGENIKVDHSKQTQILEGEIPQLEKNKPYQVSIQLLGLNTELTKHIRFEARGLNARKRIFTDGIFSSNIEASFEKKVQEVEIYKQGLQSE